MKYIINTLLFCFLLMANLEAQDKFCATTDSLGAGSFFGKAQKLFAENKLGEAVVFFEKARASYEKIGCTEQMFLMYRNLLKVHLGMGNIPAFNALFDEAIAKVEKPANADESIFKGRVYLLKSNMYLRLKQLDSALVFGDIAKKIHEQVGAWKYYIRDNNHMATVAYYKQDYEVMERYIDNSFSAHKTYRSEKSSSLQEIMRLYGALYYKTGEYEKALEKTSSALEVALEDLSTRDDTSFVAACYNNIGLFYIELGDIYKSEDYSKNALHLYTKLGNHFEAATTYLNLGEFFGQQGKLEEALDYYKQGIKSIEKSRGIPTHQLDKSSIGIYNGIGDVATQLKRFLEASEALKMSLEIHKREESKKDETFSVLAMHHSAKGEYDIAKDYLEKALEIRQKFYGAIHPLVASVYFELGKTEEKKNNNAQAGLYYDLAEKALVLPSETGNLEEGNISDKSIMLQIMDAKAQLFLAEGSIEKAYTTAQSAVGLLEKMRNSFKEEGSKLFMLQKMIPTYELSIGLAYDLYQKSKDRRYIEDAFQLVEKSKAMLLLDALKTEEARNFGNVPKELLDEERRLARERVRYEKLLFEAKANVDDAGVQKNEKELLKLKRASEKLQTTLEKKYPKYHKLKYDTKIASLTQIQESLDAETALIEYFVGNDKIYIFAIYKDTTWLTPVTMNSQFTVAIKGLRVAITDMTMLRNDPNSAYLLFAKNARTIYQKYLEPALKKEGINRLVLIPDGLLNYVPFDVLQTEKPDYKTPDFKNLSYLIKKYNINYHYSSTLKLFSRSAKETNGKMLAMASSYNKNMFKNMKGMNKRDHQIRSHVGDLPGAKREVKFLSETFAGKFLYGDNASEEAFKYFTNTSPYSVIHLAMHGVVDSKQPDYSSLVFSYTGSEVEDDLLHAYELNLLEMSTDLVVLSACETGFGKYERGEGVVSLGRGFMYSGAPSLVMTLWPINDKATSILISEFYNQLAAGFCKDEAMRNAKLKYLEASKGVYTHPFFWASFINLGNYDPIYLYKHWHWWQIALCFAPILLFLGFVIYKRKKKA